MQESKPGRCRDVYFCILLPLPIGQIFPIHHHNHTIPHHLGNPYPISYSLPDIFSRGERSTRRGGHDCACGRGDSCGGTLSARFIVSLPKPVTLLLSPFPNVSGREHLVGQTVEPSPARRRPLSRRGSNGCTKFTILPSILQKPTLEFDSQLI